MAPRLKLMAMAATVAMGLGAISGCGPSPVATKGTVHVGGKPLANATVMFIAQDAGGKDAFGMTKENGAFELTTGKVSGALPGAYKITIVHSEPAEIPKGLKTPDEIREASANAARKPSVVPEIYTRVDQTPLKHRVPQDGDAKIEINKAP
jgi:hypothetical protein